MTDTDDLRILRVLREAEGYLELELYDQALAALRRLPDFGRFAFHADLLAGHALREQGRYPEAAVHFERALQADPKSVAAAVGLGWCYKRMARLPEAIGVLEKLHRRGSPVPIISFNLGCYWALAGEIDKALAYLKEAIAADPDYAALARQDADLESLRHLPAFRELLADRPIPDSRGRDPRQPPREER